MKRPAIALPGAAFAAALVLAAPLTTASPAGPFATNIDAAAIERAIVVGRSADEARQRFHQDYFIALNDPLLERLEIVTEFRRVVLTTEDRVRARDTDWGPTQAAAMLQPWRNKIVVILHVNFPPNNVYRVMPRFDLILDGRAQARAPGRIEPLDLLETPLYINAQPAPPGTPILAGMVQATFGTGTLNPRGVYPCGIVFEGRELRRVEIDFGRLE